jgi:hypothetical protein
MEDSRGLEMRVSRWEGESGCTAYPYMIEGSGSQTPPRPGVAGRLGAVGIGDGKRELELSAFALLIAVPFVALRGIAPALVPDATNFSHGRVNTDSHALDNRSHRPLDHDTEGSKGLSLYHSPTQSSQSFHPIRSHHSTRGSYPRH